MSERQVRIGSKVGLHARPASLFAKAVKDVGVPVQIAKDGQPHKVAALYQNDDYGKGYLEGFKDAIKDAPQIEIVKELSYEAGAASTTAPHTIPTAIAALPTRPARPADPRESEGSRIARSRPSMKMERATFQSDRSGWRPASSAAAS